MAVSPARHRTSVIDVIVSPLSEPSRASRSASLRPIMPAAPVMRMCMRVPLCDKLPIANRARRGHTTGDAGPRDRPIIWTRAGVGGGDDAFDRTSRSIGYGDGCGRRGRGRRSGAQGACAHRQAARAIAVGPAASALWTVRNSATGKPRGVPVTLGTAMAQQLKVPASSSNTRPPVRSSRRPTRTPGT